MKICEGIQRMSIYEDDMESILLADYIDWKKLKEKRWSLNIKQNKKLTIQEP